MEGSTTARQPRALSPAEKRNLAAVTNVLPFWNGGDVQGVLGFYEHEIVWTNVALEEVYEGHAGVGRYLNRMLTAFPDLRFDVTHKIPRGDRVAERWVITGTHLGPYLGIPPTGRHAAIHGMSIVHLPEGRFLSDRFYFDTSSVLRDMGLMPSPGVFRAAPARALLRAIVLVSKGLVRSNGAVDAPTEPAILDDLALSDGERQSLALLTQVIETFNRGGYRSISELVAHDVALDNKMFVEMQIGREALVESLAVLATGFPDATLSITQTVVRDDEIACEFRLRGRHHGPFLGVPPTGRQISIPGISHLTIRDGKIAEIALYADSGMLWRQLGLMPPLSFLDTSAARVSLWIAVNRARVIAALTVSVVVALMSSRRKK